MPLITSSFTLSTMLEQDGQRITGPCASHMSEDVTESTGSSTTSYDSDDSDDDSVASFEIAGKYGWFFNKNGNGEEFQVIQEVAADKKSKKKKSSKKSGKKSKDGRKSKKSKDGKSKKSKKSSSDKKKKVRKTISEKEDDSSTWKEQLETALVEQQANEPSSSALPPMAEIQVPASPKATYLAQTPASLSPRRNIHNDNDDYEQQRHLENQRRQERMLQTIERLRHQNEEARAQQAKRNEEAAAALAAAEAEKAAKETALRYA